MAHCRLPLPHRTLVSFHGGRRQHTSYATGVLREVLSGELDSIRSAGTWKEERVITTPQAASIAVRTKSGRVLNFCANNYLGLSVNIYTYAE